MMRWAKPYVALLSVVLAVALFFWDSLGNYFQARYHTAALQEALPLSALSEVRAGVGEHTRQTAQHITAGPRPGETNTHTKAKDKTKAESGKPGQGQGVLPPAANTSAIAPSQLRVLFAGDSLMQGVAPYAAQTLRKHGAYTLDLSKQSTGLTVVRFFDWPAKIKETINAEQINTLAIFIGANDPWDIYRPGKRIIFPSEDWRAAYAERVNEILTFAQSKGVKVYWVGMPDMKDTRLQQGVGVQNAVFESSAKTYGAVYVPTQVLLSDGSGQFSRFVKDEAGKIQAVRAEDGVHFTPRGQKIIASALLNAMQIPVQTASAAPATNAVEQATPAPASPVAKPATKEPKKRPKRAAQAPPQ